MRTGGLALVLTGCVAVPPPPSGRAFREQLDPAHPWRPRTSASSRPHTPPRRELRTDAALDYDEAAVVALAFNPDLRELRAQRGIAHAQIVQAGILPNPRLTGSLDIPTSGPSAGISIGSEGEISWALSPLIAVATAVGAERRGLEAVELDIAWREWQVTESARLGVVRLAQLGRRRSIARQIEQRMRRRVELLEASVDAGDATALELSAARAALRKASLAVLKLVQARRSARLDWLAVLGLPPTSDAHVAGNPRLPARRGPPTLENLLERLPRTRLDLLGMRRAYEAQDGRARAAALRAFPEVEVGIRRSTDTGQVGTVGFSVSIALPIFDRNQGRFQLALATRDSIHDAYLARLQRARSEVARAHADLRSVGDELDLARSSVLPLEHLVRSSERLVRGGDVSVIDLYELRLRLLEVRLRVEELLQSRIELGVALDLASGMPWTAPSEHTP